MDIRLALYHYSGQQLETNGLFRSSLRGNELLTGGEFGVEASALVIIPGIVIGVYLLVVAYKRHCFIRPYWARDSRAPGEALNEHQ